MEQEGRYQVGDCRIILSNDNDLSKHFTVTEITYRSLQDDSNHSRQKHESLSNHDCKRQ